MIISNKRFYAILIIVACILLIPFIAMQLTSEMNWELFDFLVIGTLLLGAGILLEFVLRRVKTSKARILIILIVLGFCVVIWAELAVGIFGSPFAGS